MHVPVRPADCAPRYPGAHPIDRKSVAATHRRPAARDGARWRRRRVRHPCRHGPDPHAGPARAPGARPRVRPRRPPAARGRVRARRRSAAGRLRAPIRDGLDRGRAGRRLAAGRGRRPGLVGHRAGPRPRAARPVDRRPVVVHPGRLQRAHPLRRRAAARATSSRRCAASGSAATPSPSPAPAPTPGPWPRPPSATRRPASTS